jgi:hypothetical protein
MSYQVPIKFYSIELLSLLIRNGIQFCWNLKVRRCGTFQYKSEQHFKIAISISFQALPQHQLASTSYVQVQSNLFQIQYEGKLYYLAVIWFSIDGGIIPRRYQSGGSQVTSCLQQSCSARRRFHDVRVLSISRK